MKKKLLSCIIALVVIASSVAMYRTVSPESVVYAAEFRSGFKLEPTLADGTGIQVDTAFILTEEDGNTLTEASVKEGLTITPKVDVEVTKEENAFRIRPVESLPKGSVIVVAFNDVTWAFMTQTEFSLLGVFPRNEARGVPTSSGIELAFNFAPKDIEQSFTIEPNVEGSFEYKDQRVIFVPAALEPATIYTVTLSGDIAAKDSKDTLGEDVVFRFRTAEEDVREQNQVYVQFGEWMNAVSSTEAPQLDWNYYSYDKEDHDEMTVKVYPYSGFNAFEKDAKDYLTQPRWLMGEEGSIDVSKRSPSITFTYEPSSESMTQRLKLPETLDKGQYLVQVEWEDKVAQTFLQVSDVTVSLTEMNDATVWWVHDIKTGNPISKASIKSIVGDYTEELAQTNKDGFVSVDKVNEEKSTEDVTLYTVQSGNDMVLMGGSKSYARTYALGQDFYWDYLDTDKGLYQKDDTVHFFGFLKDRREDTTDSEKVTIRLSESRYYYWDFLPGTEDNLNYIVKEVSVKDGFYEGSFDLPNLKSGSYQLTVSRGDTVVSSAYLTVDTYTKPSYEMTLSHDKEAVFAEEPVTFTLDARFFEGTPVANLGYDYRVGFEMDKEGTNVTDEMGTGSFTYTPKAKKEDQDDRYLSAYVNADLPESGELYAQDSVRVFYNDMYLERRVTSEEDVATVTMQLNAIDLDKYNKQVKTKDEASFIGKPISDHKIKVTLVEHQWKRKETGEHYDDINNEVVKEYEYYTVDKNIESKELSTDTKGESIYKVTLKDKAESYYTADIELKDGNGRTMRYSQYLTNRRYPDRQEMAQYPEIQLNQDSYRIGDTVTVNVTQGKGALEADGFLYIVGQNGYMDALVSQDAKYERAFKASDIPNTEIKVLAYKDGVYEDIGNVRPTYDMEQERIDVTIETDKDTYKPGDTMTVDVKAIHGDDDADMPLSGGHVLLKMVDEALLALNDNAQETLQALYQSVRGGFIGDYQSHGGGSDYMTPFSGGLMEFTDSATADSGMSGSAADEARTEDSKASEGGIRSDFKDTAAYVTVNLDNKGEGKATITLPDNITGWKLSGIALTSDLKAGDTITPVDVSLPFFLNTALNSMYLTGDEPYVGVTVYGNGINQDTSVDYTVTFTHLQDKKKTTVRKSGKAFRQLAIPMGELKNPGSYEVLVEAKDKDGHYDGYKTTFNVYNTYLEKVGTRTEAVSKGMRLDNVKDEEVGLTFVDAGISRYLSELYHLSYASGKRLDQTYVREMAKDWMKRIYDQEVVKENVELEDYRQQDGGYSLFPYGESEIETTIRMIPLLDDELNRLDTINYLRNAWYNDKVQEKGAILYGLASLGEPVLNELNHYADTGKHSLEDQLYVAYAYTRLGDTYKATTLFGAIINQAEEYEQQAFVKGEDLNQTVELTGISMLLAQDLDMDMAAKFYTYMISHYSDEDLSNAWIMDYIMQETKDKTAKGGKVILSYQGQERTLDLSKGYGHTLTIPGSTLSQVEIKSVEGDVNVIVTQKEAITTTESGDEYLKVTRHYESYQTGKESDTFKEGDIVKVVLDVDIDNLAIDNSYRLTDYVPSGLKPIEGYWNYGLESTGRMWYRDINDQKVSFYAYRMEQKDDIPKEPFIYYARIVSLGEFKAEAPMLQGLNNPDVIKLGEKATVTITKNQQ